VALTCRIESRGHGEPGARTPQFSRETAIYPRSGSIDYDVVLNWRDGLPFARIAPPGMAAEIGLTPQSQAGFVDLGPALLDLLGDRPDAALCHLDIRVYNGVTSARITLSERLAHEDGVTCRGSYTHLGGFNMIATGNRDVYALALDCGPIEDGTRPVIGAAFFSELGRLDFRRR
jgi:hypothetical protein